MSNPNDNQNAYQAALQINRKLKREIDELKEEIAKLKAKSSIKVPLSHSKDAEVRLTKEEYMNKIGELHGI